MTSALSHARAFLTALRNVPQQAHWERETLRMQQRAEQGIRELAADATWTCELHGDAWRRPDGRFVRVMRGTWPLFTALSRWDAEDFHGYRGRR